MDRFFHKFLNIKDYFLLFQDVEIFNTGIEIFVLIILKLKENKRIYFIIYIRYSFLHEFPFFSFHFHYTDFCTEGRQNYICLLADLQFNHTCQLLFTSNSLLISGVRCWLYKRNKYRVVFGGRLTQNLSHCW